MSGFLRLYIYERLRRQWPVTNENFPFLYFLKRVFSLFINIVCSHYFSSLIHKKTSLRKIDFSGFLRLYIYERFRLQWPVTNENLPLYFSKRVFLLFMNIVCSHYERLHRQWPVTNENLPFLFYPFFFLGKILVHLYWTKGGKYLHNWWIM